MREVNEDGEWDDSRDGVPPWPMRSVDDLFAIARYQRVILFCVLFHVIIGVTASVGAKALLEEFGLIVQVVGGVFLLAFISVEVVFMFLLATKVYGTGTGIAMAIFTVVPCLGLLLILLINGKATSILKEHDVRVGLMGAFSSDLEELKAPKRKAPAEDSPPRKKARRVDEDEV